MLSVDLISACARRYILQTREIKAAEGTIITKISPEAISQVLGIPEREPLEDMSVAVASEFFEANKD